MLTVRHLMTKSVVAVQPEVDLRSLINLLVERHVSGVPVVRGRRPVGVVSATDVMALLAGLPGVPTARTDFLEQGETEPLGEWQEGAEAPQRYFAEQWNESGAELAERFERIEGPEWDLLAEHTVAEAMTRRLAVLPPDTPVAEAARFLVGRGIHRALVVDGEGLLGVLSMTDLVRAIADGRLVPSAAGW
ncbi:MAG: CBS domain-containing protein [Gemmatimonadales bacterium]